MNNTPYDDAFRTLLNDSSKLILPLVNEVFGTDYDLTEEMILSNNEAFFIAEDDEEEERITDSSFQIRGIRYHIECQSTEDGSMVMRMFEYDVLTAMRDGETTDGAYRVRFPHSAVLYLRSTKNTPDALSVTIEVPGDSCTYQVPIVKVDRFSVEKIFDKELWFLIPFHIFTHEKELAKMEKDEEKLEQLAAEYQDITDRLTALTAADRLTAYDGQLILTMTRNVLKNLAQKHQRVTERMEKLMGGHVLNYEAKDIYNAGKQEGRVEGREEGRVEGRVEGREEGRVEGTELAKKIFKFYIDGKSNDEIAELCKIPIEKVENVLS